MIHVMLQFFKVLRNGLNRAKKVPFLAHFWSCFVYTLVHPMKYTPNILPIERRY